MDGGQERESPDQGKLGTRHRAHWGKESSLLIPHSRAGKGWYVRRRSGQKRKSRISGLPG